MTDALLKELKQLDDKMILTEVNLLESRAAHAIQNMPRAKVGYEMRTSPPKAHVSGCPDIRTDNRKFHILPTIPSSSTRSAIGSR